jgi:DNA-binding GntR family transcriptional regulator
LELVTPPAKKSHPYLRIASELRDRILSGSLAPGDPVPSTRQLMRDYNVAMATAAKVLSTLKAEGLTDVQPGAGTVVAANRHNNARDRMVSMRRGARIYPEDEFAQIVSATVEAASTGVAEALGVLAGSPVIRRHRITSNITTGPVSVSTSWFAGDLAATSPELLDTNRILEGTPGYIERTTGRVFTVGRERFTASAAEPDEAAELRVQPGFSVMRGRNWIYDQHGFVVEYGESVVLAGRWFTYDYKIAPSVTQT